MVVETVAEAVAEAVAEDGGEEERRSAVTRSLAEGGAMRGGNGEKRLEFAVVSYQPPTRVKFNVTPDQA